MTTFPGTLDSFDANTDDVDDVLAADMNNVQDAVVAIETELGTDPAGSCTDLKTRLAHSINAAGMLEFDQEALLTISSGAVTVAQNLHRIETEGGAASDYLDTINGNSNGLWLIFRPTNDAHTVVVRHNVGNIYCVGGSNISLDAINKFVIGYYDGTLAKWVLAGAGGAGGSVSYSGSFWSPDAAPDTPSAYDDEFNDSDFDTDLWTEWDESTQLTISEEGWGLDLLLDDTTPTRAAGIFQAAPADDYTLHAKVGVLVEYMLLASDDWMNIGFILGEDLTNNPDTSNWSMFGVRIGRDGSAYLILQAIQSEDAAYTSLTVEQSSDLMNFGSNTKWQPINSIYIRLRFDCTESEGEYIGYLDVSMDGLNWLYVLQGSLSYLPAEVGLGCFNEAASGLNVPPQFRFGWFRETDGITFQQDPLGNRISYAAA